MLNPLAIQVFSYVSFFVFLGKTVHVLVRYATMPIHLRWELYPVAHEKGRDYGGSYLEDVDWWTRPRKKSLIGNIKYMGKEGLLFEQCYKRNRGLWYWTYPFHIGIFLLAFWLWLLVLGAALHLSDGSAMVLAANRLIFYATIGAGSLGLPLCLIGCIGLLIKRVTDADLRPYTAPGEYLNLSATLIVLLAVGSAWCFNDPTFVLARGYAGDLISFTPTGQMRFLPSTAIVLFSLFFAYLPFGPMQHGLAKYFTYHRVRWDDKPNLPGNKVESRIKKLLDEQVMWSGPHIQWGKKWSILAREAPGDLEKKAEGK
jgi:nitrate reductase gamma subunit